MNDDPRKEFRDRLEIRFSAAPENEPVFDIEYTRELPSEGASGKIEYRGLKTNQQFAPIMNELSILVPTYHNLVNFSLETKETPHYIQNALLKLVQRIGQDLYRLLFLTPAIDQVRTERRWKMSRGHDPSNLSLPELAPADLEGLLQLSDNSSVKVIQTIILVFEATETPNSYVRLPWELLRGRNDKFVVGGNRRLLRRISRASAGQSVLSRVPKVLVILPSPLPIPIAGGVAPNDEDKIYPAVEAPRSLRVLARHARGETASEETKEAARALKIHEELMAKPQGKMKIDVDMELVDWKPRLGEEYEPRSTFQKLERKTGENPKNTSGGYYDIIYFVGHGRQKFTAIGDHGVYENQLCFVRPDGLPHWVSARKVLAAFGNTARLVCLAACEGAAPALTSDEPSIAELIAGETFSSVETVVAMQQQIQGRDAEAFAEELFECLFGRGNSLEDALANARHCLESEKHVIPVFYHSMYTWLPMGQDEERGGAGGAGRGVAPTPTRIDSSDTPSVYRVCTDCGANPSGHRICPKCQVATCSFAWFSSCSHECAAYWLTMGVAQEAPNWMKGSGRVCAGCGEDISVLRADMDALRRAARKTHESVRARKTSLLAGGAEG